MIGAFLTWWRSELAGCVPDGLRRLWSGAPRPIAIDLDPEANVPMQRRYSVSLPFSSAQRIDDLKPLSEIGSARRPLPADVTWPSSVVLERRIALPPGAARQAPEIARLDLAKETPIDPSTVLWRHRVSRNESGSDEIHQFVLKRKDLETLEAWLQRSGLCLRRLFLDGDSAADERFLFLDNSAELARPWRFWRWLNAVLLVLAVLIGGTLIWLPHAERADQLAMIKAELPELQATALRLRSMVDLRRGEAADRAAFLDELSNKPRFSNALASLNASIPDHSWIDALEFNGRVLRFSGQSRDSATDLIAHLSDPEEFRLPELIGPVTHDARQNTERFTIQVSLGQAQ